MGIEGRRGPGRPRVDRPVRRRIDATISEDAYQFLRWLGGNQSAVIDEQIKQHPRYNEYVQQQAEHIKTKRKQS